jgi:ring-1,2-phenylacetyl-CoA epoxidase subunit PaaE
VHLKVSMSRFHALKVAEIRRLTAESVSIGFAIPAELRAEFAFAPGQYLTLRSTIDGEDIRRSYSICSALDENLLRIGVKKVEGGAFSAFANESLKPGDLVEVMPPEGRFTIPEGANGCHILAIAAGSGITPILSIAKSLLARDGAARVTLIYGNRTSNSVMFAEEIEDLKNRYLQRFSVVHIFSREPQDVPLLHGRITAERIGALARAVVELETVDHAFLCGPEGMIDEARSALQALGMPNERIRSELFTASTPRRHFRPPLTAEPGVIVSRVSVKLDGKRHAFDMLASDENVVDAAARAGIDLPYSCHGGMCCTCRCKLEKGEVAMAVNYSLEDWEMKAGYVLACQSTPKTAELSLDFDQM